MNKSVISILSSINNLNKELSILLPKLLFKEITSEADYDQLYSSEIIIADFDLLNPHLKHLSDTKWIQGTWAGVDKLLPYVKDLKKDTIVTRYSGKHFGRIMSEYVIANIVNYERNIYDTYENKKNNQWVKEGKIQDYRCIYDLRIGILGIGTIGNYIAKTLHNIGAKVWGFGRKERDISVDEYKHLEDYCSEKRLSDFLEKCDYIINVMPNTTDTTELLGGGILENCKGKETVFINIGRGNIIKECELVEVLKKKWLSGAILDVFNKEPLPEDCELWKMDQVFITPHTAGISRSKDIAEMFCKNYEKFMNGETIPSELTKGSMY